MTNDVILEMENIRKTFPGVVALDGVNLVVAVAPCTPSWARTAPASPRS